jgi:dTDP-4-amino-4,6-dideoxygalactose transaminase
VTRIFLSPPDITGRERQLVDQVFESNYVAPAGEMLDRFERNIADYTGIAHGVAVSSGTAALHLALRLAGVSDGDEVWTSSMTFIGGVSPITYLGATPVFFDLSPASWTIDCDLLEEALEAAAKSKNLPKAIVPTDLYGQACDHARLNDLGARFGVVVVSDTAEALGALQNNVHAGRGAHITILSFNGNKIITTSGGGMLLSDDEDIVDEARKLSTQAREKAAHYEHEVIGYNYRMSNVCAAIGVGQLEQLEDKITRRREIFANYQRKLSKHPGLVFMPEPNDRRSTRWLTCMTIDPGQSAASTGDLQQTCEQADIEVRPLWKPMHLQPVFKGTRFVGPGHCERLFETGLCLPSGSGLSDAEQDRVISAIESKF